MFKYDPCSKGVEEDLHKDETERKKKKIKGKIQHGKERGRKDFEWHFDFFFVFKHERST